MTYEIIDNIDLPTISHSRNREKSEFTRAVDALEVGQGFHFDSIVKMKQQYSRVAPRKFGGKRFTVVELAPGKFAVKRVADKAPAPEATDAPAAA